MTRNGHAYTPEKTRRFEAAVRAYAAVFAPRTPLSGPLALKCKFYFKPPVKGGPKPHLGRPDLSNLCKAIEDALEGAFYPDDSLITELTAFKLYDWVNRQPRIEVELSKGGE